MKQAYYLILGLLLSLLSGCWGQHDIERVASDLMLGIELSKTGKLLLTPVQAVFGKPNKDQDEFRTIECESIRESREIGLQVASRFPEAGKINQLIFSEEIARQGLFPWLELFQRDPLNPPHAAVVVVDGSPQELIEKAEQFKDKPRVALYIHQLLENNRDQFAVINNIMQFDIAYFAPGLDPAVPIIKLVAKDIRLSGTALFKDDQMVDRLDLKQSLLLLTTMGRSQGATYIFQHPAPLPGKGKKPIAATRFAKVKRKIKIKIKNNLPEVTIDLKISGVLSEYLWDRLDKPQSEKKLTKSFETELTKGCNQLFKHLQQVESDPVGIGDLIRARHYDYWKQAGPQQVYKNARIQVKVRFNLSQYGNIY